MSRTLLRGTLLAGLMIMALSVGLVGTAAATDNSPNGTKGSISLDEDFYKIGDTLNVTIEDGDLNDDPNQKETYVINIESNTEDQATVGSESNKAGFNPKTNKVIADRNGDNVINATDITFIDKSGGGANSPTITSVSRTSNGKADITFDESGANVLSNDEIEYTSGETVSLEETGQNSSTFEGSILLVGTGKDLSDDDFAVSEGDKVNVTYHDASESTDLTAVACIGTTYACGDGSTSSPYQIATWTHLDNVRQNLDANFTLVAELNASTAGYDSVANSSANGGKGFDPIGDQNTKFTGSFDGAGYIIANLTIDDVQGNYAGLFGHIRDGSVSNVSLKNTNISVGNKIAGGLAGTNAGTISGSSVTGDITSTGIRPTGGLVGDNDGTVTGSTANTDVAGQLVGGLVGVNDGTITDSSAMGATRGSDLYAGGLVGRNAHEIKRSYASGPVSVSGLSVGGLVGKNDKSTTVRNTYATGNTRGSGGTTDVGGLVGRNGGTVSLSFATGKVDGGFDAGGLVADDTVVGSTGTVTDGYWDTESSGEGSSVGGTGLTTAQMTGTDALDSGNMDALSGSVWTANADTASERRYPTLQQNPQSPPPVKPLYDGGDGSVGSPYQIATWTHLDNVRQNLDANFTLVAELNASTAGYDTVASASANSGKGFEPIGDQNTRFAGSFDGAGYTMANLTIDRPASSSVGLFGEVGQSATVNQLTLSDLNVTGNKTVGGVAGLNEGAIRNTTVSGNFTGIDKRFTNVGGLVGKHNAAGELVDVNASGSVTGIRRVGGLVGTSRGTVTRAHAAVNLTGQVRGGGGLVGVGQKAAVINHSSAEGFVSGLKLVGGLVGYASKDSEIIRSHATGNVSGNGNVGGLVGKGEGAVKTSYATGDVDGKKNVGGLVGSNKGNVTKSYATGLVNGTDDIGGLVEELDGGAINNSHATGGTSGSSENIGGLVGKSSGGSIDSSYATGYADGVEDVGGLAGDIDATAVIRHSNASGNVTGRTDVGGLVGDSQGTIETSSATGNVGANGDYAGGLVGEHDFGTIRKSYATGPVQAVNYTGGLVGKNIGGDVTDSYATGPVFGSDLIGGLIGVTQNDGNVTTSYATGNTSGRTDFVGGLIGLKTSGTVTDSYWDRGTTNQSDAVGGGTGTNLTGFGTVGTGEPADEMTGDDALDSGNMAALSDSVWSATADTDSERRYPTLVANLQSPPPGAAYTTNDKGGTGDPVDKTGSVGGGSGSEVDGGGGGGGGGGSSSTTFLLGETVHTQTLDHSTLSEIAIDFAEPVDGLIRVAVVEAPDRPTIESSAAIVGAVSITPPQESTETNATLAFTLNATALEAREIDPTDIVVYRIDTAGSVHEPVAVTVTAETDNVVTVAAETPGFSAFVLATTQPEVDAESEAVPESVTETADESPAEEPLGDPESTTEDNSPTTEASNAATPGFGPLIALVALVMLALAAVGRGRQEP